MTKRKPIRGQCDKVRRASVTAWAVEHGLCSHNRVFDHGYGVYTCWNCGTVGDWLPRKRRIKWRDERSRMRKMMKDVPGRHKAR